MDSEFWEMPAAAELEWDDDDIVCQRVPPVPTEPEYFRAVLNQARERQRSMILEASKVARDTNVARKESSRRERESKPMDTKANKIRDNANKTYLDFLLHKRNEHARHRVKQLKSMGYSFPEGEDVAYYSMVEGVPPPPPSKRRHTFHMERDAQPHELSWLSYTGEPIKDIDLKGKTLSDILAEGPIDWDKSRSGKGAIDLDKSQSAKAPSIITPTTPEKSAKPPKSPEKSVKEKSLDLIIDDVYYPGLIDDAVNRKVNFNEIVFDLTFSDDEIPTEPPPEDRMPISLVEAFDKRVERDKGAIKKTTMQPTAAALDAAQAQEMETSGGKAANFMDYLKKKGSLTRVLNREELVLASTIGIDVSNLVQNRPMNELIKAINNLQRAEWMNDYDKSAQAAEQAYEQAPPELAESAAIFGARNFRTVELSQKKAQIKTHYNPIEVVSYMGITKPMPDVFTRPPKRNVPGPSTAAATDE